MHEISAPVQVANDTGGEAPGNELNQAQLGAGSADRVGYVD